MYVGLGPRGESVASERLSDACEAYGGVLRVTHRGRFALVEMSDAGAAAAVINGLDNSQMDGVTLKVREDARGNAAAFGDRRRAEPTGTSLFVGLGPNGREVTQDALLGHLAAFGAVKNASMRGSFAIVEAASVADAARLCREASGSLLQTCRLSVREDRGGAGADGGSWSRGRGGSAYGAGGRGGRRY